MNREERRNKKGGENPMAKVLKQKDIVEEYQALFDMNRTLYHLKKDSKENIFPARNFDFTESEEKAITDVMEIFGNKMNILDELLEKLE